MMTAPEHKRYISVTRNFFGAMASSRVHVILLVVIFCSLALALEYPKNMKELQYIEHVTDVANWNKMDNAAIAGHVLKQLTTEYDRLRSNLFDLDGHVSTERKTILVKEYLSFGEDGNMSCRPNFKTDALFMMDYHSKDVPLFKYLHFNAFNLFERCKVFWENAFKRIAQTKLDEWTRSNMARLMECLINASFASKRTKLPKRPYSQDVLSELANRSPTNGIVLYLARIGDIWLDENMKSESMLWEDFEAASNLTLLPFCRDVCKKLEEPVSNYADLLIEAHLIHSREVKSLIREFNSDSGLLEYVVGYEICCKIAGPDGSVLRATYEQLVSESESSDMSNKELAMTDFDYD